MQRQFRVKKKMREPPPEAEVGEPEKVGNARGGGSAVVNMLCEDRFSKAQGKTRGKSRFYDEAPDEDSSSDDEEDDEYSVEPHSAPSSSSGSGEFGGGLEFGGNFMELHNRTFCFKCLHKPMKSFV